MIGGSVINRWKNKPNKSLNLTDIPLGIMRVLSRAK
jgi:hypothetical protein